MHFIEVFQIFAYLGIVLFIGIIAAQGKMSYPFPGLRSKKINLHGDYRQKIFELVNEANRRLQTLKWIIGENAKWLELREMH